MKWMLALLAAFLIAVAAADLAGGQSAPGSLDHPVCPEGQAILVGSEWQCTHGEDPFPPRVEPLAPFALAADPAECRNRPQMFYKVLYVNADNQPSRFTEVRGDIIDWVEGVNVIFRAGAGHGLIDGVAFERDAACQPVVHEVTIPAGSIGNFGTSINAVRAAGFDWPNANYLMFVDSGAYCGIGTIKQDDSPDPVTNRNASGGAYARVDVPCWGAATASHEIVHNLGGVQRSAPNSTEGFHCTDEYDLMCYMDGPGVQMDYSRCPETWFDAALDCGQDDYWNPEPAAGSYLAANWNVARSPFLLARVAATPTPQPTAAPTVTPLPPGTVVPDPDLCEWKKNKRGKWRFKCK